MELINQTNIESLIFTVRGQQVMLDFHLAAIYEVETKRLNEQVKRNIKRFPETFMFQLTSGEWEGLHSQIATTTKPGNLQSKNATAKRRTLPYVFTEQGESVKKDLVNKCFAFISMDNSLADVQNKLLKA